MTRVALFEEFEETNLGVEISTSMFDKLKPWYIKMNKIHDCYTFRYHFEFQLYYDTFVYFCKRNQ